MKRKCLLLFIPFSLLICFACCLFSLILLQQMELCSFSLPLTFLILLILWFSYHLCFQINFFLFVCSFCIGPLILSKITSSKLFSTTSFEVSINAQPLTNVFPGIARGLGPILLQMSQPLARSYFSSNFELAAGSSKFSSSISSLSCSLPISLCFIFYIKVLWSP